MKVMLWLLTFLTHVVLLAARRTAQADVLETDILDTDQACCCKEALCDLNDTEEIYSPNQGICCKFKSKKCGHIFSFSKFDAKAPDESFCQTSHHVEYQIPPRAPQVIATTDLKPGHPAHTVQNYCDLGSHEALGDEASVTDEEKTVGSKKGLMQSMVNEITSNSIDVMAKEIFSIYVCTRWAPNSEFLQILQNEISAEQLPKMEPGKLYSQGRFIPLRCSENFQVFSHVALGETSFENFEQQMKSLAEWYGAEKDGAVSVRLAKLKGLKEAKAFDLETVVNATKTCTDKPGWSVSIHEASTDELFADCQAVKWWLAKLRDWHRAMPFTSFMSPNEEAAKVAPKEKEQILMCFGKRVASQLHRREGGQHLMTDQNAIGCHGFWDMQQAGSMLDRILKLWRPPTCQLASMELDMKVKIMELMANMNSRLFDALPALLTEEISANSDFDGKALAASSLGVSLMRGMWQAISSSFSALRGQYTRLGQLLGSTVVKWAVCPLKNISTPEEVEKLDMALGTEDDLARYYAEIAYAKWTGHENLLRGEECEDGPLEQTKACSLGIMQQDMPEPYKDEKFICPVRPLLPAKQQLEVLQKKKGWCPLRMNSEQMKGASWFYRGRTPQKTQYDMVENLPQKDFQAVRVMDFKSRQDSDFHLWRSFATISLQCTQEEMAETPRWCKDPQVHHSSSSTNAVLDSLGRTGRGTKRVLQQGLHKVGMAEEPHSNKAGGKAFGYWLYNRRKGAEAWIKETTDAWFGKASDRYTKLREKSFLEIEAAELLHSVSFQRELESTGADSKRKQRYDRFASIAACKTMDPEMEFDLKYEGIDDALQMARKAHQKFEKNIFEAPSFTVKLMGVGILQMKSFKSAWVDFLTLLQAGNDHWVATKNAMLGGLAGTLSAHGGESVRASDLLGFEATFHCGSRKEMHDLEPKEAEKTATSGFSKCVIDGAKKNKELRKASPGAPYLRDEVVVRVDFRSFEKCGLHLKPTSNGNETKNPVYETFQSISGCRTIDPKKSGASYPKKVKDQVNSKRYRGLLLGSGMPDEMLFEIVIDPEDFLQEVPLE